MLSIITAIHNQKAMNQLFWQHLIKYTKNPFELIIIDNASTDGSREFFTSVGAKVIANSDNYSYPHSQNQGIAIAQYEYLAFLNNDIIVAPNWDQHMLDSMNFHNLEVATSCGIEKIENRENTRKIKNRWKAIKNIISVFGSNRFTLMLMHKLMYRNKWEKFCDERYHQFKLQIKEGFVGNTVVIKRSALDKIGLFDEQIQMADFDLYLRTKMRALHEHDIKPVHICLDVFNHHYIRLTMRSSYFKRSHIAFADAANLIDFDQKWDAESRKYIDELYK